MAKKKISQLAHGSALSGEEKLEMTQGGATKYTTPAEIAALAAAGLTEEDVLDLINANAGPTELDVTELIARNSPYTFHITEAGDLIASEVLSAFHVNERETGDDDTIAVRNGNFTANGPSGTTYTVTGFTTPVAQVSFEADTPINTTYSFFVTDNSIELRPGENVSNSILFWDGSNSHNTGYVLLVWPGMYITIKKLDDTQWLAIAVNGATNND